MKSEVPVFQVEGLGFMGEVWAGGRHWESSADRGPRALQPLGVKEMRGSAEMTKTEGPEKEDRAEHSLEAGKDGDLVEWPVVHMLLSRVKPRPRDDGGLSPLSPCHLCHPDLAPSPRHWQDFSDFRSHAIPHSTALHCSSAPDPLPPALPLPTAVPGGEPQG